MPEHSRGLLLTIVASAIVLADQLAKSAIVSAIGPGARASRIDILDEWLALEYAENRGAAFGFFTGVGSLLPWVTFVIIALLLSHHFRSTSPPLWETMAIALIVGGAIGNLVDRIRLGYVIDFVSVGIWPNFNVADSAITIGVLIAIWGWLVRPLTRSAARVG